MAPPGRADTRRRPRSAPPAQARSQTCSHRPSPRAARGFVASRRDRQQSGIPRPRRTSSRSMRTRRRRSPSALGDVALLDGHRVRQAPPSRGAGGVFPGSGVLGFFSRARVRRRGFCRGFRRGLCRGFRRPELEKCLILAALCGRNPGQDRTVLVRKCPIVTALYGGNPGQDRTVSTRKCPILTALFSARRGRLESSSSALRRRCRHERTCPRRWRHTFRSAVGEPVAVRARIANAPHVCVPAAADAADELELSGSEQRRSSPAVGPIGNAGRGAQLLRREVTHRSLVIRERRHRREEEPLGAPCPAVGEHASRTGRR